VINEKTYLIVRPNKTRKLRYVSLQKVDLKSINTVNKVNEIKRNHTGIQDSVEALHLISSHTLEHEGFGEYHLPFSSIV